MNFFTDISKHIIVSLIAVHSQEELCACCALSGTPVSRRDSSEETDNSFPKGRFFSAAGRYFPRLLLEVANPEHQKES